MYPYTKNRYVFHVYVFWWNGNICYRISYSSGVDISCTEHWRHIKYNMCITEPILDTSTSSYTQLSNSYNIFSTLLQTNKVKNVLENWEYNIVLSLPFASLNIVLRAIFTNETNDDYIQQNWVGASNRSLRFILHFTARNRNYLTKILF